MVNQTFGFEYTRNRKTDGLCLMTRNERIFYCPYCGTKIKIKKEKKNDDSY